MRAQLSESVDVELLNLSAHGGWRIPSELNITAYAEDLLAQIDARGLDAPIVLGHSCGGVVALYLAVLHPTRVSEVITVATRSSPPKF